MDVPKSHRLLDSYGLGGQATFNILFGYEEALLRGFRLGFLTDQEYHHIKECDNLEDVKLNLQDTDYGEVLQGLNKLTVAKIKDRFLEKLVAEFSYLRAGAMQPLAQFLDFIKYDYMIDNVMLILKATYTNPNVKLAALVGQLHPLGKFEESTLKSIISLENSPSGFSELLRTVLIDTPIGKYFAEVSDATEINMMKLDCSVRKLYLEEFYFFCKKLGGGTGQTMCELLRVRADAMAINITLNSFGTAINEPNVRVKERQDLYPSIGNLYPEGFHKLSSSGEEVELAGVLKHFPIYKIIFEKHQQGESSIDDAFYALEVMMNEVAFEGQFNYSCFYAYIRLREQEIRNVIWICECIIQKQKKRMEDHYVPLFSKDAPYRHKD